MTQTNHQHNTECNNQPALCGPYTVGGLQQGEPCCQPRPILEVRNLAVYYGNRPALEEVSLDVHEGCITALIGPSGCGKTSFLFCLNRMTDLTPGVKVQGSVLFDGLSIFSPQINARALRSSIGMIFQKPNPFPLSIRRNLELPLQEQGVKSASEREARIEDALRGVGLWAEVCDRLGESALGLSGGQQQRLCIARATVLKPRVLLMDEPCSALDPIASGVVEDLIAQLQGQYTVVIVTHNLAQARRIANYAGFFWLKDRVGSLIEFGRCQQLFDAPAHALTAAYVSGARG